MSDNKQQKNTDDYITIGVILISILFLIFLVIYGAIRYVGMDSNK